MKHVLYFHGHNIYTYEYDSKTHINIITFPKKSDTFNFNNTRHNMIQGMTHIHCIRDDCISHLLGKPLNSFEIL